ncbi:hypothetical protein FRC17_004742 [Serendipita sp. 399]|nr:hypothetical protein FRC17_004742 [Serendipita sp. 399]
MSSTSAIPRAQIFTLLALQAVVAFSFECIFPFVNQFLLDIGVVKNPADAGFYSGVVESAFAISQLVTVFPATWASDYYGRKPVIILGTLGVALAMAIFGVSTTYWMMIFSRILGGGVGGGNTAIRVMCSELIDKASESRVFSWIVISYRTGQIVGQPVGGLLSHPERHWPNLFGNWFWRQYPYALPCFVAAAYALLCAIVGQLVLRETLRSKRKKREGDLSGENTPLLNDDDDDEIRSPSSPASGEDGLIKKPQETMRTTIRSVLTWPLVSLLISNAIMVLLTEIFFATYPLFAFTPVELGGLGLSEAKIGMHMSVRSAVHIVIMFPFSRLQRRFSSLTLYRVSLFAWIPTVALFPILNSIARRGDEDGVWWYLGLALVFSPSAFFNRSASVAMVYSAPLLVSDTSAKSLLLEKERLQLLKSIQGLSGNSYRPAHRRELVSLRDKYNQIILSQLDSRRGPWADPMVILPVEIWINLVSEIIECRWGTSYRMLSHSLLVSKKWRAAILSTPQFWTQISLEPGFGEEDILTKIEIALHLSRDLPLTVYIDHPQLRGSYEKCRALLAPHSRRIRRIIFRVPFKSQHGTPFDPSTHQILLDLLPLPELQEIQFKSSYHVNGEEWNILEMMPNLRSLDGAAIPFNLVQRALLVNLETLTIQGSVNKLFRILNKLPRLKDLTVSQATSYSFDWSVDMDDETTDEDDTLVPEQSLSLENLTWLQPDQMRLRDLLRCSPHLTALTVQASWKLLGLVMETISNLPRLSYLSVDMQSMGVDERFSPAKVTQTSNIRELSFSSEWFRSVEKGDPQRKESLKLIQFIESWQPTIEMVENLTLALCREWTVPVEFVSSMVHLRVLNVYLPGFNKTSNLSDLFMDTLEELFLTLPSGCFEDFLSHLQAPRLLLLSLSTSPPQVVGSAAKETIHLNSEKFPKLSALHWLSGDLIWSIESYSTLKLVAFMDSASQLASDFCVHLILRPCDFPSLEQVEFYIFPEWDLLFLMLERRNFLLDSSIKKITNVILPTTVGLILRGTLTALLRGEIYFDQEILPLDLGATGAALACKHAHQRICTSTAAMRHQSTRHGLIDKLHQSRSLLNRLLRILRLNGCIGDKNGMITGAIVRGRS